MNKQGPGKIDWTDWSWNPISGCYHGCPYCYLLSMARRFKNNSMEHKFHADRLVEPLKLKSPAKIFVGSAGDMFGAWVPCNEISVVFRYVSECPHHIFQFLTKNPARYGEFDLPVNGWYGTTVDGTTRTEGSLAALIGAVPDNRIRFVSFEPLLHRVDPPGDLLKQINGVIIGADSRRCAVKPPVEWADHLIDLSRTAGAAVFVKDNYQYHTVIKELP